MIETVLKKEIVESEATLSKTAKCEEQEWIKGKICGLHFALGVLSAVKRNERAQ